MQTVAIEMRTTSVYNYCPTQTHVQCVINEHHTVREALTIAGDHCAWCSRNDPDECFWIMHNINMGHQVKNGRNLRNNQVQHFLYKNFIEEEYSYLRVPVDDNAVRVEVNSLPHMPLPGCIENEEKNVSK